MKMTRCEYLLHYDEIATWGLRDRWPFSNHVRVIDSPAAPPAWVSGVFKITLTLNRYHMDRYGTGYRAVVVNHELRHMRGHHGFWALLTLLLCFPLFPLVRVWQEWLADRSSIAAVTDPMALEVFTALWKRGWLHRLLYGRTPAERLRRAQWPTRSTRPT